MTNQTCAATHCDKLIFRTHLMCGSCWARVPKSIQIEVYATLRAYKRARGMEDLPEVEFQAVRDAYKAAKDSAILAVRASFTAEARALQLAEARARGNDEEWGPARRTESDD